MLPNVRPVPAGLAPDSPRPRAPSLDRIGRVVEARRRGMAACHQPVDGGNDVFVHISAVERAGLTGLGEGQKVSFELKTDKMRGKTSAENLALL